MIFRPVFALWCSILFPATATAQLDTPTVRIRHGATCDTSVTLEFLKGLTHHAATIKSHDGVEATYEGAWLKDVLRASCGSIAAIEKRTMVNTYMRIGAGDGYTAGIALTEADSSFRERPVILAWMRNGQPLDDHDGPLQLIIPDDMRHARDVRHVAVLEVIMP